MFRIKRNSISPRRGKKKTERGALEWLDPFHYSFHYSLSWSQGRFEIKSFHSKIVLTVENNSFHDDENDRTRFRTREKKRLRFANPIISLAGALNLYVLLSPSRPDWYLPTWSRRPWPVNLVSVAANGPSESFESGWGNVMKERYILLEEREKFPWARNVSRTCRKFIYRGEKTSLVMEL